MWTFDDPVMFLTTIIALWSGHGVVGCHSTSCGRWEGQIENTDTAQLVQKKQRQWAGTVVVVPNATTYIYQINLTWEPVLTAMGANN